MAHGAIIGLTTSGKTYLARKLAGQLMQSDFKTINHKVMVLRKKREEWAGDECSWQTFNPDEFINEYRKQAKINCDNGTNTVAFLELSDASVEKYDTRFHRLFCQGRHDGFRLFYLSQRGAIVHPTIRENCVSLYLFTCGGKAAKIWAEEFCDNDLIKAAELPPHYFMHKKDRYSKAAVRKLSG